MPADLATLREAGGGVWVGACVGDLGSWRCVCACWEAGGVCGCVHVWVTWEAGGVCGRGVGDLGNWRCVGDLGSWKCEGVGDLGN